MSADQLLIALMALFAVLGALDRIFGGRFGIGREFESGILTMGSLALAMVGIVCLAPVLAAVLRPVVVPVFRLLGADAAMFAGSILACDMGGGALARELTQNADAAALGGVITGSMLGATVVFTIPVAMGILDEGDRPAMAKGILCGIITIPVGVLVGGLVAGFPLAMVAQNLIPIVILAALLLLILASCVKIVPQAQAFIVERLGGYQGTWEVGMHFKTPFVDRVAKRVNLKEQVVDFDPQPVITKDNVTMQIDTVVFFQITDPKLFTYGVENPIMAIENLTATTLRNIIGDMELDQTLTSRETINTKMRASLDVATDPWGIKVNRVELKNILPPAQIVDAMEKQMKAERERREAILKAEGEKKSLILVAEGKKQSAILDAEAEKQAAILKAEAEKEKMIREAEGEAEAIRKVQTANAESIRLIREAGADQAVLALKSFEAMTKVADGKATKIIIPSDMQNLSGIVKAVTEVAKD